MMSRDSLQEALDTRIKPTPAPMPTPSTPKIVSAKPGNGSLTVDATREKVLNSQGHLQTTVCLPTVGRITAIGRRS